MRYPFIATFCASFMVLEEKLTPKEFQTQLKGRNIDIHIFNMFHSGEFPDSVAEQAKKADIKTAELPPEVFELPFELTIGEPTLIAFLDGLLCKVGEDVVPIDKSPAHKLIVAEMTNNCAVIGSGIVKSLLEKNINPEIYSEIIIPLMYRVFQVHRDRDQAAVIASLLSYQLRKPEPKTIELAHIGGSGHTDLGYFLGKWADGSKINITSHKDPRYPFQLGPMQEYVHGKITREEALECIGPLNYSTTEEFRQAYITYEIDKHIKYDKFVALLQKFGAKDLARAVAKEKRFQLEHPEVYIGPKYSAIRVPLGQSL